MAEINPKNFIKKINDINSTLEKHSMFLEKLDVKSNDLSEKVNQTYKSLKTIGNVENISAINSDLQKKMNDINELTKYIERISVKAEKTYVDLNERLNGFVLYKTKQDTLDESVRDILKNVDRLNLNFENYMSKKDMDSITQEMNMLQTSIQELSKALPIVQMKVPENIMLLKKEKEDIDLFMRTLREQMETGRLGKEEYETIRMKNDQKLASIDDELRKQWEMFSHLATSAKPEDEKKEAPSASQPPDKQAAKEMPTGNETQKIVPATYKKISAQQPEAPPTQQAVAPANVQEKKAATVSQRPKQPSAQMSDKKGTPGAAVQQPKPSVQQPANKALPQAIKKMPAGNDAKKAAMQPVKTEAPQPSGKKIVVSQQKAPAKQRASPQKVVQKNIVTQPVKQAVQAASKMQAPPVQKPAAPVAAETAQASAQPAQAKPKPKQ